MFSFPTQREHERPAEAAERGRAEPPPGRELPDLQPLRPGDASVQTPESRQGDDQSVKPCRASETMSVLVFVCFIYLFIYLFVYFKKKVYLFQQTFVPVYGCLNRYQGQDFLRWIGNVCRNKCK